MAVPINNRWMVREVYRRPDNKYYYYNVRDMRTGRVHRGSTKKTRRPEAWKFATGWCAEQEKRESGRLFQSSPFEESFRSWVELKRCRQVTKDSYLSDLEGIYAPAFEGKDLGDITREDVKEFLKGLHDDERSVRTQRKHLGCLRSFFSEMVADGKLGNDPTAGLKIGKGADPRETRPLTPEEVRALLAAALEPSVVPFKYRDREGADQTLFPPDHLYAAAAVAVLTGLRKSTIFSLTRSDVDLKGRLISIDGERMKAGVAHTVPVCTQLAALVLEAHCRGLEPKDLLFTVAEGTKALLSAGKRAKIPGRVGWHRLRHTTATLLNSVGVPGPTISRVLAHGRARDGEVLNPVTGRYIHPGLDEARAALEKLGSLLALDAPETSAQGGGA